MFNIKMLSFSHRIIPGILLLSFPLSLSAQTLDEKIDTALGFAATQLDNLATNVLSDNETFTDYTNTSGAWNTKSDSTWCSGFIPGYFWLMYDYTGESKWLTWAEDWTDGASSRATASDNDTGFQVYLSAGLGYQVTGDSSFWDTCVTGADTFTTQRYHPTIGAYRAWQNERSSVDQAVSDPRISASIDSPYDNPYFEVNVDMMMNIELPLYVGSNGGDSDYVTYAVNHADKTWENQVRDDYSTYHVAAYAEDGSLEYLRTHQGWTTESTWSRGEAWAVYGYAMVYRYTGLARMLERSEHCFDYFMAATAAQTSDFVPYSDFDAALDSDNPRDTSAAAIVASAAVELYGMTGEDKYLTAAENILDSLITNYLADQDEGYESILLQGSSKWGADEVGTTFGDFYFLEAMMRYKALDEGSSSSSSSSSGNVMLPEAQAGTDITETDSDDSGSEVVSLNGSGSFDLGGSIVSYEWTWDGGSASGETVDASFPVGTTEVTLTVTDNDGAQDSDTVSVTIEAYVAPLSFDERIVNALSFAETQLENLATNVLPDYETFTDYTNAAGVWDEESETNWCSGFVPGFFWEMYENSGDDKWLTWADGWTEGVSSMADQADNDTGFQIYLSSGYGYNNTEDEDYKTTAFLGAETMATQRYNANIGCYRSWPQNETDPYSGDGFEVNIDMLMNMELPLWVAAHGGPSEYVDYVVSHADTTWENQIRKGEDNYGSHYHVAEYDMDTGELISLRTEQGYSTDSTWSRGQAWAVYGYTMIYRYTELPRMLSHAEDCFDYFMAALAEDNDDYVAYADFDAPLDEDNLKDTSASAIVASAALELYEITGEDKYLTAAENILNDLTSDEYLAEGTDYESILLKGCNRWSSDHSKYPNQGTTFGDFYFIEALMRYQAAETTDTWAGYPILVNGKVDTGDFLGELDISNPNRIYSSKLDGYIYTLEEYVLENGAWVYCYKDGDETSLSDFYSTGDFTNTGYWLGWLWTGYNPWLYSYDLNHYLYMQSTWITTYGSWTYISK